MAPKKSVRNKLRAKLVTGEKLPCVFCRQTIDEEVSFGKLYEIGDIQCHYFCVLLSSCLVQKGKDGDGLYGFLYEDILLEVERSKKHKCSFCGSEGATLGCSVSQCKKQFHLPCGRERQAVSLFYGNYKSFCHAHAPKQVIPANIMAKAKLRTAGSKLRSLREKNESRDPVSIDGEAECVCVICYELISGIPGPSAFWPPCCAKDAWFHRPCLERMALSAGVHYLKCPLCNDKDIFREAVIKQGYYVPDRDAAWELEQNAFSDMYERAVACVAECCLCDMGRAHDADTGQWDIRPCLLCGSCGIHAQCWASQDPAQAQAPAPQSRQHFVCRTCRPAAPLDLEALATSIEAVAAAEQRRVPRSRSGPVMPSRMSLRRTKGNLSNAPSSSRQLVPAKTEVVSGANNTALSREELNLKPPTRPSLPSNIPKQPVVLRYSPKSSPNSIKDVKSPFKDSKSIEGNCINPIRLSFDLKSEPQSPINVAKPPKLATSPLNSPKSPKKEVNSPLKEGKSPFKNSNIDIPASNLNLKATISPLKKENCHYKAKSPFKDGNSIIYSPSPKKRILEPLSPVKDCTNAQILNENPKHMFKKKSIMSDILNNLFDGLLKENNCGQMSSKQKQPIKEWCSPRKETEAEDVEAQQSPSGVGEVTGKGPFGPTSVALLDSSIEISEMDDTGRVDVTIEDQRGAKADKNRCALKFSPSDKEILRDDNVDIDLEMFKSRYLNEVTRETAKQPAHRRRGKRKREERIVLEYEPKARGRARRDIKVRIKWRKERLRLKISDGGRERSQGAKKAAHSAKDEGRRGTRRQARDAACGGRKRKLSGTEARDKSYTQYVLQYSPEVTSKIVRPEHEVPAKRRAYTRQGKSRDKLVQTSLDTFFQVKPN